MPRYERPYRLEVARGESLDIAACGTELAERELLRLVPKAEELRRAYERLPRKWEEKSQAELERIGSELDVIERRIADALGDVCYARLIAAMDRFVRDVIVPLLVVQEVLERYETEAQLQERDFVRTLRELRLFWYFGGTPVLEYPLLGKRLHDGLPFSLCPVWHALQAPYVGAAAEKVRERIRAAGLSLDVPEDLFDEAAA